MQDDAQRIDVRRGGDRALGRLLGGGVADGHQAPAQAREVRREFQSRVVDELGDAEIEQLHLPRGVHENVGGLQVAVHDEVVVRVGDGREHLAEERQARGERKPPRIHVRRDRLAFHVLHRKPGLACLAGPGIVEARDVGVGELREDVALAAETLGPDFAPLVRRRELERHLPREAPVGLLGQPHFAHAAAADEAKQAKRADALVFPEGARGRRRELGHRLHLAGELGALVGGEHALEHGRLFRVGRAQSLQPARPRAGIHLEGRGQQRLDLEPEFAGELQGARQGSVTA